MSIADEASAEWITMIYEEVKRLDVRPENVPAFEAGKWVRESEWQASRKPEAAPSVKAFDTSREPVKNGAVSLHVEAAPSDTDREALANLIPLGFTERDPVRNVYEAADRIFAAGFSRSQPVQVEVTTATLQRLREAVYAQTGNHTYLSIEQAENVLAALGGGDQ